jgi:predicted nucleotidyltransferase
MNESTLPPRLNELLRTLRYRLAQALSHELAHVILYGSRARGEARPDSDVDVLIVVNGRVDYPDLMQRTSAIVAELSLQHEVVISRTFASAADWENARTPFLINVRREGMAV